MGARSRRDVMRALVLAGGAVGSGVALAAPARLNIEDIEKEATVACLYHCDFGDPRRFDQMLDNISNHYSVYGANPFDIQILIVAHGPGVKFFLKSLDKTVWSAEILPPELEVRVESLSKNGLKVLLCNITFTKLNIDTAAIRDVDYVQLVESGVATAAALQSQGFAYLKVA